MWTCPPSIAPTHPRSFRSAGRLLAALTLILSGQALLAQPTALRYKWLAGDHLIYRQTIDRRAEVKKGQNVIQRDIRYQVSHTFETHVLTMAVLRDTGLIGIQRNHQGRNVRGYRIDGRDTSHQAVPEGRVASRFSEGNRLNGSGQEFLPWSAIREFPSPSLAVIRETIPLPSEAVSVGQRWKQPDLFGIELEAEAWENVGVWKCLRVASHQSKDRTKSKIRYWFSPELGAMTRIEWTVHYDYMALWDYQETVVWQLEEKRQGELISNWLADPNLRLGALCIMQESNVLPVGVEKIVRQAAGWDDDAEGRRMALSIAYRRRAYPANTDSLIPFVTSGDPRMRILGIGLAEGTVSADLRSLIELESHDTDPFVRTAAAAWMRTHTKRPSAIAERELEAEAAAPADSKTGPADSDCGSLAEWPQRVLRARRFPPEVPGATLRPMQDLKWNGRPYVAYVPENYRGDRPFPLVVYLSGSGGLALEGIETAFEALSGQGYLAVMPDAGTEYWWHETPAEVVRDVLQEAFESFNIDPNRVYLTGFSNGGTGTIFLGARWTDRFAAAVPMMGAGTLVADSIPRPPLENLGQLPILFLHGAQDREVEPPGSVETAQGILAANPQAPVQVRVFANRGHEITLGDDNGLAFAFFAQQRRNPYPRRIRFSIRDLRDSRRFWIQVMQKEEGQAKISAEILDDNTIEIEADKVEELRLLLQPALFPRAGPIRVVINGRLVHQGVLENDCSLMQQSYTALRDPFLAYSSELTFSLSSLDSQVR